MNYSIIQDMLLNFRCSSENIPASENSKIILKKLEEFEEIIKQYLPEEEKEKIMWEYSCLQGELNSDIESTSFTEGFKIGLLIGAEVFSDIKK